MATTTQRTIPGGLGRPARWTAAFATACGIHCLLSPVVVGALPFLALSESVEWWALGVTVVLGAVIISLGPARHRGPILLVLGAGAGIWCASLLGAFEPLPERVTSPVGSLVFAAGMLWSARICHSGDCDRCEES